MNRVFYLSIFVRFIFGLSLNCFLMAHAYATALPSRLSVQGYASDYLIGEADWLLPITGSRSHVMYLDPRAGYGSDNKGYADLGLGYRWLSKKAMLWGVYLFGGYSRIENDAHLWVANPGVEALGRRWDAHLNTYFVMGDRHYKIGDLQKNYFTNHAEFAQIFHVSQYSGHGADVKLAYQPFRKSSWKGYLGSYFFDPKQTSTVWGGAAGVEYWLDAQLKIFAHYTYDNLRHSTGAVGIGLELGGTRTHRNQVPCLQERLTDPVARYIAELGHGSAIPSQLHTQPLSTGPQLVQNNIAFFSQAGYPNNGGLGLTVANCTFENPCGPNDLTNQGVNDLSSLLPNTIMYFNGGAYNALNVVNGTTPVRLLSGQSVWGRAVDYLQPAKASERSVLVGWLELTDKNTVSDIKIMPLPINDPTPAGIGMLPNASEIRIMNSQIGDLDRAFRPSVGIASAGAGPYNNTAMIDESVVFARNTGINFGGPSLKLSKSLIYSGNVAGTSTGIRSTEVGSIINIQSTQVNVTSSVSSLLIGLQAGFANTQMTANNITIQLNALATGAEAAALIVGNLSTSVTVNEGFILSNSPSPSGSAFIIGGGAANAGLIEVNQGQLSVNASTASILKSGSMTVFTSNASTCFVNDTSVIC